MKTDKGLPNRDYSQVKTYKIKQNILNSISQKTLDNGKDQTPQFFGYSK